MTLPIEMQAAVYHGPDDLRVEAVPIPVPGTGEVVLKVYSASICGTDLRIFHGRHRKFPPGTVRIPGHELVGEIAALGAGVSKHEIGEWVFVAPNMGCGTCKQCISGRNNLCADYQALGVTVDGAFAEYVRLPAAGVSQGNLIPVDPRVDPGVLALIEPFACVLHGQEAVDIQPGETVLVMGAGPIGLMHLLLARLRGASQVIVSEPQPGRLIQARQLGADWVVDPNQEDLKGTVYRQTNGTGVDVVIVAAPAHQAMADAVHLASIGGRVNFFAGLPKDCPMVQVDVNQVHYREIRLTGTTACSTGDCRRAAALVASGQVDLSSLVSQRFPLSQAVQAFAAAEEGLSLKIVLEP